MSCIILQIDFIVDTHSLINCICSVFQFYLFIIFFFLFVFFKKKNLLSEQLNSH